MAPPSTWTVSEELMSRRKSPVPIPASEEYNTWTLDQLKLECTSRKLGVKKNTNKEERVALLSAYDSNKESVKKMMQRQRSNSRRGLQEEERRTKNCMFRLLNVLFSNRFFHDFLSSGDQLSKSELDQGGSAFWHGIATAFSSSDIEFDRIISDDSVFEDMDPSQTMTHSAAKLQRMWREVSSNFARAEAGSKKSGEHGEDFWDFCGGRADVFYLHKWCEHRGAGREFCAANLYSDDEDDSEKGRTNSGKTNRKRRNSSQAHVLQSLVESIRTIAANEGSQAEERTWKEQALLIRDKRITNKLGLLYTILERTDAQIEEVKEYIRDHGDGINEDGYDVRGVLTQANIKRRKLCTQISELEDEVAFDVEQQQVV